MSSELPIVAKKKKGSMRRLKGLITGKSRRDKKKAKHAASSVEDTESVLSMPLPDDASTVYGADFDAQSASASGKSVSSAQSTAKSSTVADPVQIILLIMDPATRRFELLQLEFDSALAKVSDIYKQIPSAATEELLQKASYKAIITAKGVELDSDANLSDCVDGAAVVIAIPESSNESVQKCASMAIPILTNPKVNKMVSYCYSKFHDTTKYSHDPFPRESHNKVDFASFLPLVSNQKIYQRNQ